MSENYLLIPIEFEGLLSGVIEGIVEIQDLLIGVPDLPFDIEDFSAGSSHVVAFGPIAFLIQLIQITLNTLLWPSASHHYFRVHVVDDIENLSITQIFNVFFLSNRIA